MNYISHVTFRPTVFIYLIFFFRFCYEGTINLPALGGHTVAVSQSEVSLHILAVHHKASLDGV